MDDLLRQGDAVALDHRGTSPMVMLGVPLDLLLREFLGHPDELCGGRWKVPLLLRAACGG